MATIKKISGLVILTTFFLSSAFAEAANGSYSFSLSPYIGILYGRSEEIVYKEAPNQNLYQSELLWDLKPLIYAGFGADFSPRDPLRERGFIAALSFKAGLPLRSGIIEDRDWDNLEPNYYLTRYSRHDAYSRTAILLDVSAGYFQRFSGSLALNFYGEFSYMHFSWSGRDGYTQYASETPEGLYLPWNSNLPKSNVAGNVVLYKQDWFIFSPGVSLEWNMNRLFSMKTCFNYSPLIYCADRDDHLIYMKRTFLDYLSFGNYFKLGGELTLSPSQNTSISFLASYKRISGTRGDTVYQSTRYKDEAGAGYSALDLGLAVKFRIGSRE